MSHAAALKEKGNELFKAGKLTEAADYYAKAEKADCNEPVYPSNLSASLHETGDYEGSLNAILRAWNILQSKEDTKPDLVVKLATRLAKSLAHGARARKISPATLKTHTEGITSLQEAAFTVPTHSTARGELARVWEEWNMVKVDIDEYERKADGCLSALSRLPIFSQTLDQTKEFYGIGHDDIIDLTEGWGPENDYPLDIKELPMAQLSEVSFLFGGVGDGRHVFGTLSGLLDSYKKLTKAKKTRFKAHMTLLDINEATVARDLCLLTLLGQLNHTTGCIERAEIHATLMYMFCGAVMPSYCYDRLQKVIEDLRRQLTATPLALPGGVHVGADTVPAILRAFDFWATNTLSTQKILAKHECLHHDENPALSDFRSLPGASAHYQEQLIQDMERGRERVKEELLGMPDYELKECLPANISIPYFREHADEFQHLLQDILTRKLPDYEERLYRTTKVFIPPQKLRSRHPDLDAAAKRFTQEGVITLEDRIEKQIKREWKPNFTLVDSSFASVRLYPKGDGYPNLRWDIFDTIHILETFARRNEPGAEGSVGVKGGVDLFAADVCEAFFGEAAEALKVMKGRIMLEFICGGLSEELAKIRFGGELTRPKDFPRTFMRMWLSNVPDYTHGPLNMILYVAPNLQDHPQAAVACNSLSNTRVWSGDTELIHTYTLLLPEEIPRYLACPVKVCLPVMEVLVLGWRSLPRPLSELATREELVIWLTRVLFNTLIPYPSGMVPPAQQVRLPHNLVAFFGLIMHLHRVGYPGHWLSDLLARVLSGRMLSNIAPHLGRAPIPVTDRLKRVPERRVRTDPWLVELETILATSYYALPFSLPLPADFTREPADVGLWEARVRPPSDYSKRAAVENSAMNEPRMQLLVYRADLVSARVPMGDMRRIFDGATDPPAGTFFVLTALEHLQYDESVRFRMSKRRVARMRAESARWCLLAYRNDWATEATDSIPIQRWVLKE